MVLCLLKVWNICNKTPHTDSLPHISTTHVSSYFLIYWPLIYRPLIYSHMSSHTYHSSSSNRRHLKLWRPGKQHPELSGRTTTLQSVILEVANFCAAMDTLIVQVEWTRDLDLPLSLVRSALCFWYGSLLSQSMWLLLSGILLQAIPKLRGPWWFSG